MVKAVFFDLDNTLYGEKAAHRIAFSQVCRVVSSEEAGCEKPDRAFFLYCAAAAGLPPEEILYVGDSLEGDVLGAESAGMRALWYAPGRTDFDGHAGISHFDQLQNRIAML